MIKLLITKRLASSMSFTRNLLRLGNCIDVILRTKMLALIAGYNYNGTLRGIEYDIGRISRFCKSLFFDTYISTDLHVDFGMNKFDLADDMKLLVADNKCVLFFFTGHGSEGRFNLNGKFRSMNECIKELSSNTNAQVICVLDCCNVIVKDIPKNAIIIAASGDTTKAEVDYDGSPFLSNLLLLLKESSSRDVCQLAKKLKVNHPHSNILSHRHILYGWFIPGDIVIDYSEECKSIIYYNRANPHRIYKLY